MAINTKHKDRLFKFIFGNSEYTEWTLSLYNAINNTNYTNKDDILITTIDDVVYMSMKNDVSFLVSDIMNFYEQQSTFNPNMPMRYLIYAGMVYSKYIEMNDSYNIYSSKIQHIPTPKCICFYNGTTKRDEREILKLSDAFTDKDCDIEVKVYMININYGHNKELLEACKPLYEYSWLIHKIREYKIKFKNLERAIDVAIDDMDNNAVIKPFLIKNKAEVKSMCITEYDEEKYLAALKEEALNEGIQQGREEGELSVLISLVHDGTIDVAVAAKKFGTSEKDFLLKMKEQDKI